MAAAMYAVAAVVLAIGAASRQPNPAAVATAMGLGAATAGVLFDQRKSPQIVPRVIVEVLFVGIVTAILLLLIRPPVEGPWHVGFGATAGGVGALAILHGRSRSALLAASLFVQTLALCLAVNATPARDIDVYWFGQLGSQALIEGQNPYELEYPNIYGTGTDLYAPEVQAGDVVTFGYPYPPLSLLMGLPSYLVAGDFRYAAVLAVTLTGALAYLARPGALSAAAALLLVISPLTLQVLLKGWIEPFVGLAFAAAAFAALKIPRFFPYFLGLALVIKQYMVPLWLLALLLVPSKISPDRRILAIVPLLVAAAIVLPFLIWSPSDFLFDVVILQALQPFREDSVGLPGLLARAGGAQLPTWVAFLAGGAAIVVVARYGRQTVAGLCGATAFVFLVFFFFSKQAFMNYYFFTFVVLIFAVALAKIDRTTPRNGSAAGGAEAVA